MPEPESNSLEYLSGVFKMLPKGDKDYVIDTARALLKIQDDNSFLVDSEPDFPNKN